jgi:C4-type Zn-finger protein
MRVSLDTTTAEFLGSFEPQLTQEPMITVTAHCPVCAENVQTAMPLEALSYAELKSLTIIGICPECDSRGYRDQNLWSCV